MGQLFIYNKKHIRKENVKMKFNASAEIDNYSPEAVGYFSLKNDGDTCRVRVLYESINDVEGHCVHKVALKNGGFKYVDCLREYSDPLDACPLCSSNVEDDKKLLTKIWVPLYKVDSGEAVLWERGKAFWKKVLYPLMVEKGEPFCGHTFTIERQGAAGDTNTTYEFIDNGVDDTVLDDFDEIPDPVGNLILQKSYEELESFIKTRTFDDDSADEDIPDIPIKRRGTSNSGDAPQRRGTTRPNIV